MGNINKDFIEVLSNEELKATQLQLDTAVSELIEIGTQRESVYGDKGVLAKRARELQTEIQLAESDAIMNVQGSGKDAYGIIGNRKIFLTNDTARDAYRREASRKEREELAQVEGQLDKINAELFKITDSFNAKAEALRGIQAKARLQAALLESLA